MFSGIYERIRGFVSSACWAGFGDFLGGLEGRGPVPSEYAGLLSGAPDSRGQSGLPEPAAEGSRKGKSKAA